MIDLNGLHSLFASVRCIALRKLLRTSRTPTVSVRASTLGEEAKK
jgi:hypothetical protein